MRAYRNVNLNIPGGMISLPVSIAAAVDSGSDPKPKVVGPEGQEVEQVYVEKGTDTQVSYQATKRQFGDRVLTQDEIKAINDQCKIKDLDIIEVCDQSAVDFSKGKGQYFVYSHKKNGNPKAFGLFVEALKSRGGAALVKWTPSSRQQLLALTVNDQGALLATALPFGSDVKDSDEEVLAHTEHKPSEEELELAGKLLDMVSGDGSTLTTAVDEVVEKKQALIEGGEVAEVTEEAPKDSGADLMAQLQASLDAQS